MFMREKNEGRNEGCRKVPEKVCVKGVTSLKNFPSPSSFNSSI